MSFSGEVKEELAGLGSGARHCQIAELAAILVYSGAIDTADPGREVIALASDSPYAAARCLALIGKIFGADDFNAGQSPGCLYIDGRSGIPPQKILQTIKYTAGDMLVNPLVIKSMCCRRAYLRGAFLGIGSMSNPQKGYHLEFVCSDTVQAGQLADMLLVYDIRAKTVARKRYRVVYIKESEEIVELLNVMGAHISLMNLENLRILKDMRNSINRLVNCETANITKTVNAAAKQIEDIRYVKEHYGFDNLTDNLRRMAEIRLEYPDATLKELGQRLTPNVGKSGVNHRLRKLSELAEKLRSQVRQRGGKDG